MPAFHHSITYDEQFAIFRWSYSIDHTNLLAYNISDQSTKEVARLFWNWAVSPASDCIILMGSINEEDIAGSLSPKIETKMIDSQGQEYYFKINEDEPQPDWTRTKFAWSPDGLEIAFYTPNESCVTCDSIYRISPDGTHLQPIFLSDDEDLFEILEIDWSPHGDNIAVVASYRDRKDEKFKQGVFLITIDTSERQQIIKDGGVEIFWSSDSEKLYFSDTSKEPCKMLDVDTREIAAADRVFCKPYPPPGVR